MKNALLVLLACCLSGTALAKKVKFSVNMTGQVLSPNGIHVSGDFQVAAGFPGANWDCDKMLMTKEIADTNIYSLIVDIPAFQKYEYKYINGDQCYEVEVVPESNRANYNFSDNRWIFIDSLANDTTQVGAVLFSGSAPAGLTMVRFRINMMQEASIAPAGVHVAGSFQGWDPQKDILYSFSNNMYEWIAYLNTGSYEFKYYNGNIAANTETVPAPCATNNNRSFNLTQDTVMTLLCYSSCNLCFPAGINQQTKESSVNVYPNPTQGTLFVNFRVSGGTHEATLSDVSGAVLLSQKGSGNLHLALGSLPSGMYLLHTTDSEGQRSIHKIIIE